MIRLLFLAPLLLPEDGMPGILDGGCGVVGLIDDPSAGRIEGIGCNGLA